MSSEMPEGWQTRAFSDAVAINPKRSLPSSGAVPFLDMASLPLHGRAVQAVDTRPVSSGGSKFQAGDTLFARITPCAENGKLGFVSDVVGGRVAQGSTEFLVMGPREGTTIPEYVRWLSGWSYVRDHAIGLMEGTSGRQRIPVWAFDEIEIGVPPLDEQRRIAEILQSVDEAIAAKQATLSATKQFKRSCREAAVQRFRDCALTPLEAVLASIDAGWSPDCASEAAGDGEWAILKTSAVVWEGYDDSENKRLPDHLKPRPQLEVTVDDILITRAGPAERTGVVAIVRETAGRRMLSDKIIRLRVSPARAVPLAIAELLSSDHVQAELIRSKSGMAASQTNISQKIMLGLKMHLPPLADQKDFADEMTTLQDAIEMGEADLNDAQRLKAALMSDLLSGRVRVPK
ncbi:MAG: restriction endonuclease subunit S [Mesorhizobium sp.]|uniref:restriction endonuclease subunit S n=1 Tax=Mesorhizobium sp. TaxID=1871066 RepID=UPI000FE6FDDA|nr:restriction endonuclease subunit S [Mesorhizobium sp.]RWL79403.1 MAG: restriction endonuclease subunit S [Mesorhizobium sp.]RWL83177.1 MAG: restriction endonuclease subunit S [Mesorhizobium sp.]RWL93969.1 MAG: restriction endonuclease subunit S [Mesorhizobium sp.]